MDQPTLKNDAEAQHLSKLPFRSLPSEAAQQIRDGILNGRLKPGERLVEQKLARELGIGQPTVREALKEIEHQGFVCKVPNKGTYVTRLDRAEVAMILEVRLTVELLAIRRAMKNLTETDMLALEAVVEDMEIAVRKKDSASFHKHDLAFHRKIWDLSGNRYVSIALEPLVFPMFAFGLMTQESYLSPLQHLDDVDIHRKILDGLRSGDPEAACAIFVEGISKSWKDLCQIEVDMSLIPTVLVNSGPEANGSPPQAAESANSKPPK
jgi:DNA-binding GntR family transcriptional regulator